MTLDLIFGELARRLADALRPVIREELRGASTAKSTEAEPLAVSVAEAAKRLGGVHPTTVRKWIKSGALVASQVPGGREYLLRPADLEAFLAKQRTVAIAPPVVDVAARAAKILGSLSGRN